MATTKLRQEKPALSFSDTGTITEIRFGMTRAQIETPPVLLGKWTVSCKLMTLSGTKVASVCDYWSADKFIAQLSARLHIGNKVPFLFAMFASNGRLIAFTEGDWVPIKSYENTSKVVRYWRNSTSLSYLDIPDQQTEISADWVTTAP
jgi:hypothetical protein